jgi:hypothetical protein
MLGGPAEPGGDQQRAEFNAVQRGGMRFVIDAVSAIAAGLALTAAACGSSGSAASGASPSHHPMASHSPMTRTASSVFGRTAAWSPPPAWAACTR